MHRPSPHDTASDEQAAERAALGRTISEEAFSPLSGGVLAQTLVDSDSAGSLLDSSALPKPFIDEPALDAEENAAGSPDIGRYQVTHAIGMGATGIVYSVMDRNLDREVAVKFLKRSQEHGGDIADFIKEARITASLQHPNVLPVHDIKVNRDGNIFFSMKKIDGKSLGQEISAAATAGSLCALGKINALVQTFVDICNALSYAHHKKIVHQDIKPDNIMLGGFGEVLLLDWGSAIHVAIANSSHSKLYGTPLYMSPEQARRERADERSDIYCLGASLFHALTLRVPTWSDSVDDFWLRKRTGIINPPTPDEKSRLPAALLGIAIKAMQADPSLRYATAESFAEDLENYQAGLAVSAHQDSLWQLLARWYGFNQRLVWVAVVALALVTAAGVAMYREKQQEFSQWHEIYRSDFAHNTMSDLVKDWDGKACGYVDEFHPEPLISDNPTWKIEDGQLTADKDSGFADLTFHKRILGDIRIEWDYTALRQINNMNCYLGQDRYSGYTFHIGGWGKTYSAVLSVGRDCRQLIILEQKNNFFELGETHHYRMERDGVHIRLAIDKRPIIDYIEYSDIDAPSTQGFGFDTCINNKVAINNIVVYHRPLPEKVSPLCVGNAFYQVKRYPDAERAYSEILESYPDSKLAQEALFKIGMTESASGDQDRARLTLRKFTDENPNHTLVPLALFTRIRLARARNDQAEIKSIDKSLEAFQGHPLLQSIFMDIAESKMHILQEGGFQDCLGDLHPGPDAVFQITKAQRELRTWSSLHGIPYVETPFSTAAANYLCGIGENELELQLFPENIYRSFQVLTQMGRFEEALNRFNIPEKDSSTLNAFREAKFVIFSNQGRTEEALAVNNDPYHQSRLITTQAQALELMSKISPSDYNRSSLLLKWSVYDELFAHYADRRGFIATALNDLGRSQEVLDQYLDVFPNFGAEKVRALYQLGRFDEAIDHIRKTSDTAKIRLGFSVALAEIRKGQTAVAKDLLVQLQNIPKNYANFDMLFCQHLFPELLGVLIGEDVNLAKEWSHGPLGRKDVFTQILWYDAAFLCGKIDDKTFLSQPNVMTIDMRYQYFSAIRAEILKNPVLALQEYRALKANPYRGGMTTFEWEFLEWRIGELTKNQ